MQINVTYDSSVDSAPAGFRSVIADVVNFYDTYFANPITINIDVGYGEIDGQKLSSNSLGENEANYANTYYTYAQIESALTSHALTSVAKAAVATLPSTDPTAGGIFSMTSAEAKALGLLSGDGSGIDAYAGFSSQSGLFDYSVTTNAPNLSVGAEEYDFFGTVAHEFSEIMGRQMNFGVNYDGGPGDGSGYYPLDLFDFVASDVRSFDASATGRYFSIDNGVTNLGAFSSDPTGDLFDWANSVGDDSFVAFANPGVANIVTANDLTLMNVLGYQPTPDFTASGASLKGEVLTFQIGDTSQGAAPTSTTGVYAAAGAAPTSANTLLTTYATPTIASGGSVTGAVVLPLSSLAAGAYEVDVIADSDGAVTQFDASADTSGAIGVGILDNANAATLTTSSPALDFFDLGGLALSGSLSVQNLYVASAVGGSGTLAPSGGTLTFAPGASLTASKVTVGESESVVVDTALTYAGTWSEEYSSSPLTVVGSHSVDFTGVDSFAAPLQGAGTFELSGAGQTAFYSGASLGVARIDQAGSSEAIAVAPNLIYGGVWDQSAGTVWAEKGDRISFSGAGDTFAGTVTGAGTVVFSGGSDAFDGTTLSAASVGINSAVVTLAGNITLDGALHVATDNLIVAAAGATLTGGGALELTNLATNRLSGADDAATLTNASDHIEGAGLLGDAQMTFVNAAGGVVLGDGTVALAIDTGSQTIVNAGVIASSGSGGVVVKSAIDNTGSIWVGGGDITVDGAVTGDGVARINGGTLDFAGAFDQNVLFGKTGVLELADSQAYAGKITGFSLTGATSLDLDDIGFTLGVTKATYVDNGKHTGGVLTVTNGTRSAHIDLVGNYSASTFTTSSDGRGGTRVVDPASPAGANAAARFAAAMAGFAAGSGPTVSAAVEPARDWGAALSVPRMAQAS